MTDDDMHRRVDWIQPADTPILRVLTPPEIEGLSAANIAYNAGYSKGYVRKRLKTLTEAGLAYTIEPQDHHRMYGITDLGRAFLGDELSVEDLRGLDPDAEE